MYANRYQPRKVNGGSLSLSVSIVGGLVAAGMLSSTVIDRVVPDERLTTYIVKPVPPPPPPEPAAEPEVARKTERTPVTVEPKVIVPTQPDQPFVARPDPGPPHDFGATEGAGGTAAVDPPKPLPPVLLRADVDPRYARDFQPIYPAAEQRAGNEGVVSLRVLIGVDGRVKQVERLASPSEAFWRVTEQRALSKWRFTPARRDGVPYESWKTMTVRFRISEA